MDQTAAPIQFTPKQFKSDIKPIWCPGCGHFAVLNAITKALAFLQLKNEEVALLSGIGCSSRVPAYTSVYGFHGIHGRALALATGEIVLIQDGDLEYHPRDFPALLEPLLDGRADAVFGSRFLGGPHRVLYFWHMVANKSLTLISNMLTNFNLTDMEVCYKVFRREIIQQIRIEEDRFGFEPEITAKVARLGCRIYEVGVSYSGRTYTEGKKIGWRDGVRALWCILRYNLLR